MHSHREIILVRPFRSHQSPGASGAAGISVFRVLPEESRLALARTKQVRSGKIDAGHRRIVPAKIVKRKDDGYFAHVMSLNAQIVASRETLIQALFMAEIQEFVRRLYQHWWHRRDTTYVVSGQNPGAQTSRNPSNLPRGHIPG